MRSSCRLVAVVALVATPMAAPAFASGETAACPPSNPPNQMTLLAGTPQTAQLGTTFATGLQVALSNSDGCPVTSAAAGTPVTFGAPASGASGGFSTTGSNVAVVGADASGAVAAPPFTANAIAGSYAVTASSQYGSLSFSLTNTAAGLPARIVALAPKGRSASVMGRYSQPLQVRVLDADGDPVAGISVTFTLGSGGAGACGASRAGASFTGGGAAATASTDGSGLATSPPFTANSAAGSFTATAAVAGKEAAGETQLGSFALSNLAGKPTKLTPGVGATQSTRAGARFPVRLAVTATDAQRNPVPHALVTFSAPRAGASGRFMVHHRARPTVAVETNACGIAVAPSFTANGAHGGYVVKASVERARPAAFALVNE